MKLIRCGMGVGDSLYLQAVCTALRERGTETVACTAYPEIFAPAGIKTHPFTKVGVQIVAHYSLRKNARDTNQWQDVCIAGGIRERIPLQLTWPRPLGGIAERVKHSGKPVVLVGLPRAPMGRADGFGKDILPDCRVIQRAIDELRGQVTFVQVGHGKPLYQFDGIDFDLNGKTTITELIDLGKHCDAVIGYCSYLVPLAEGFDKPALFVWSRKGLNHPQGFINRIAPDKVLSKSSSRYVLDDQPHLIREDVRDLL